MPNWRKAADSSIIHENEPSLNVGQLTDAIVSLPLSGVRNIWPLKFGSEGMQENGTGPNLFIPNAPPCICAAL